MRAGHFECKYDYNANYYDTPFWGHTDSKSGLGLGNRHPGDTQKLEPWKWRIHFDLENEPTADATLTLAIASADGARLHIYANNEHQVATVTPAVQGGNALLRESIHAKYCVERVRIPAADLRKGTNTITLVQDRTHGPGLHVMYDYLSLEVPLDDSSLGQ